MHPDLEMLIAWRDRELPAPLHGRVTRHVHGCARCQAEAARIDVERQELLRIAASPGGAPFEVEAGFQALLARLGACLEAAHPEQALKGRLTDELETFFGAGTADLVLGQAGASSEGMLETAGRYFAAYLGHGNAARVMERIGTARLAEAG